MAETDSDFVAIARVGGWKRFGVDVVEMNDGTALAIS